MRKKERYEKILAWFRANRPIAETELHYDNPFELLIAVILSAQCTDKRVNMITPALYRDFPTPEALAATTPEVVYEYIRSVSYPNNKAKHLVGMAKMLVKDFNSQVPDTLEELVKLPGVGRKTANVIQSVVFNLVNLNLAHSFSLTECNNLCNFKLIARNRIFKIDLLNTEHIPNNINSAYKHEKSHIDKICNCCKSK